VFPSLFEQEFTYRGLTEHGCLHLYLSELGVAGWDCFKDCADAPGPDSVDIDAVTSSTASPPPVTDAYGTAYALLRCAALEYRSSWIGAYSKELASHRLAGAARIMLPRPILAESQKTLWLHAADDPVHLPTSSSNPRRSWSSRSAPPPIERSPTEARRRCPGRARRYRAAS
jgi:hypothetical protein